MKKLIPILITSKHLYGFIGCIVLTLCLILSNTSFAQKQKLLVSGKIAIDDGKPAGTVIKIEKDGTHWKNVSVGENGRFTIGLEYQFDYILSFEKKKYVTKKISISTKLPPDVKIDEGYDPFQFNINLFKQYEGVNTVVFNQPVGIIKYSSKKDDFDFDTDYTKSIQSEISKAESEVEVKKNEEKEQQKQEQLANNLNKANNTANNDANKAKAKQDEDSKNKVKPKAENDNKNIQNAGKSTNEEYQAMLKAKAENDARKRNEAQAKSEEDKRRLAEAKAKQEEEMRKAKAAGKLKSYLASIYPNGITIEKSKDDRKESNRYIVNRDSLANEYIEVIHSWGGKYYFKNGETISNIIFKKETKPIGVEPVYIKNE
ncbi:MAG: hypothetical protein A2275_09670 [Bacteroidetes bacterium RIFOXYA12_FULL_35_11]|nr:MAG: hypothetical protein A2X01_19365 [Bacteroidetes bacterium GWF2_35_48]OFY76606.1 MAG: hypothetical protein A2275_09670 [Bacteroidetes bacterium RIFOXYA12_FULL_35_11]OFY95059.1 MAG: hypothetical protein A2309_13745 [Bacteroidetes bacterium RIFOXYB2_FULL_35_7]HBX53638.1 hypothetical protein [Bacteroidales bacterium]